MSLSNELGRLRWDEGGFTLVELLTVLTILLTVIGIVTVLMVSATKSEVDLSLRVQAQQEARLALERMRRDVHCASATNLTSDAAAVSSVTLTLPSTCPSAAGSTAITWCTSLVATGRYALRRITGTPGSCTGGSQVADYLTQPNLFSLKNGLNKLAKLCSVFPVDIKTTDTGRAYTLKDALILRNSARGTAPAVQAAC